TIETSLLELSYEDLEIGNGDSAIAAFAAMAQGGISDAEAQRLRRDLLAYCRIDTLAMVWARQELDEVLR
ncbi:hypothetical protein JYT11_00975, partial [Planctomycetaceae bacterium AH-315-I19]|nr:hypothetical protein [Planctomycetaceae bacterium AH-315-I19]